MPPGVAPDDGLPAGLASAICRALTSASFAEVERPLRQALPAATSLRLALSGVPAAGYLAVTSDLLAPGGLALTLLPEAHALGRLLHFGRPYLSPSEPDRVHAELTVLSGPAGGSAFFCAPILLPGGEPPAIGALLAGFEQPAGTCLEDVRTCHLLACELQQRHASALLEAARRAAELLEPLGIQNASELAAGGSEDSDVGVGEGTEFSDSEAEGGGGQEEGAGRHGGRAGNDGSGGTLPSFYQHWNRSRVAIDRAMVVINCALHMLNCVRNPSLMTRRLDNCVYGLAYGLGLLAVAYLSQRWPQQFALWREVPATLIPTVAFSLPQTWEVSAKALADTSLWQRGPVLGALSFWAALLFASMLPFLVSVPLCLPKRTALQLLAQVVYLRSTLLEVRAFCASPLLRHPASAAQVGRVAAALRAGAGLLGLLPPDADLGSRGQQGLECRATLSTLLVMLGYALPVSLAAAWEWRSYRRFIEGLTAPSGGAASSRRGGARRGERRAGPLMHVLGAARRAAVRTLLAACCLVLAVLVFQACTAVYSQSL